MKIDMQKYIQDTIIGMYAVLEPELAWATVTLHLTDIRVAVLYQVNLRVAQVP